MLDSGLVSAADIEEGQKSAKIESGCKLLDVAAWIHPQCNGRVRHQDRIRKYTPYRHLRVLGLTRVHVVGVLSHTHRHFLCLATPSTSRKRWNSRLNSLPVSSLFSSSP